MGTDFYQVFFADSSGPILIVNVLKLTNHATLSYTFCQKRRQLSHKKNRRHDRRMDHASPPRCVLGELWRAHTDKKTGEAHGRI